MTVGYNDMAALATNQFRKYNTYKLRTWKFISLKLSEPMRHLEIFLVLPGVCIFPFEYL